MNVKSGRYLICITRKNGDFYRYQLTEDIDEAINTYYNWIDIKDSDKYVRIGLEYRGIVNTFLAPNLFLVDLTFSDEDVLRENTLVSSSNLLKFKRIKRLYKLKMLEL